MLNRWFKIYEKTISSLESVNVQSIDSQQSANIDLAAMDAVCIDRNDQSAETTQPVDSISAQNKSLNETMTVAAAPRPNTPFRKKAITSIERTRKLSILLKHQRYMVSFNAFTVSRSAFIYNLNLFCI